VLLVVRLVPGVPVVGLVVVGALVVELVFVGDA
jgi:hypothetical protein